MVIRYSFMRSADFPQSFGIAELEQFIRMAASFMPFHVDLSELRRKAQRDRLPLACERSTKKA